MHSHRRQCMELTFELHLKYKMLQKGEALALVPGFWNILDSIIVAKLLSMGQAFLKHEH